MTTSTAPKAEPQEPLHLTQQQMTTAEPKSAANESNQKSVSATPVAEKRTQVNGESNESQESVKGVSLDLRVARIMSRMSNTCPAHYSLCLSDCFVP